MSNNHSWKFFRAGGFDQVRLENGQDLMALDQLDQKLWVALACPTAGLEFDSRTLTLIDTDKDGRIRAPELIAAVKWAGTCLKHPHELLKSSPELPLASINDATPEGQRLLASAREILRGLGKAESPVITLADISDTMRLFAQTRFNGDGVVPADAAEDDLTRAAIADIIACVGAETDHSGKPGVNQARVELFFAEAQGYSAWWAQAGSNPAILPLGERTASAAATLKLLKPKLDDYFTRCRLAAFDPRATNALNRDEKDYLAFTGKELASNSAEIASLPLALVAPGKPFPLTDRVNPAWAGLVAKFQADVVRPVLNGSTVLTEADWNGLTGRFAEYDAWMARKAGAEVEKLGLKRARELLGGPSKAAILALVAQDQGLAQQFQDISEVERLIHYHRDLYVLLNNFVSFRDFYTRKAKAIFQAGTLYLDQRSCELCLRVEDAGKHGVMGSLAGAYLAYCDCVRKATGEKMQIVAAFTGGDSDNLMVGRNGLFYDRKGRDWDATIIKIVANPISIRQAFWAPYKRTARMIQEQIAKRAAAADDASTARLTTVGVKLETAAQTGHAAPGAPVKKIDPGLLAALSVGAAGLGATLGAIVTGFLNLRWMMPLGVLAILLIISGPSMLLAWLKLRRRNLGPLLDANGWAVNAKAKINVPFGASLTQVAMVPPGALRDQAKDPFAEKRPPWLLITFLLLLLFLGLTWLLGGFDFVLPAKYRSSTVLHREPAKAAPATPSQPATNAPAPGK